MLLARADPQGLVSLDLDGSVDERGRLSSSASSVSAPRSVPASSTVTPRHSTAGRHSATDVGGGGARSLPLLAAAGAVSSPPSRGTGGRRASQRDDLGRAVGEGEGAAEVDPLYFRSVRIAPLTLALDYNPKRVDLGALWMQKDFKQLLNLMRLVKDLVVPVPACELLSVSGSQALLDHITRHLTDAILSQKVKIGLSVAAAPLKNLLGSEVGGKLSTIIAHAASVGAAAGSALSHALGPDTPPRAGGGPSPNPYTPARVRTGGGPGMAALGAVETNARHLWSAVGS